MRDGDYMVIVHEGGNFDIEIGGQAINDCFPGIDGRSIRPISVLTECIGNETNIIYRLNEGYLQLRIIDGETITIETICSDFTTKPHFVNPIFQAVIKELKGIFIQNMGLRGKYGYFDIANTDVKTAKIESIGITSLKGDTVSLTVFACNHEEFTNIYSVEPSFSTPGRFLFSAGFNLECKADGTISLPAIYFMQNTQMDNGLSNAAMMTAKAMNARPAKSATCIWSSWYYRFNYMTHDVLKEYLEGFKNSGKKAPYEYVQIDGGYCTTPGDWLSPNYQWPEGLGAAFELIKSYGYKPGIWIAPFVVGNCSRLYKEHPDFVLHGLNGKPVIEKKFYEWNKPWPNFDTEYYILDTSHPGAMEYIIDVFKTFKSLGAELFKIDFMLWGMVDSTRVKRYSSGRTSVEYFRELVSNIRDAIGEESYLLGCIAPFLPFLSFADGMRIGGDVVSFYEPSHVKMLASKFVGANYFNHVYWENDPDVVIIRDFDTDLSEKEAKAMAVFQAFTGGILGTSDPLYKAGKPAQELFDFLSPKKNAKPYYPFFEQNDEVIVACYSENKRHIIFLFNIGILDKIKKYCLKDLIGVEDGYLYEKIENNQVQGKTKEVYAEIKAKGCLLYYCDEEQQIENEPMNLWWQ